MLPKKTTFTIFFLAMMALSMAKSVRFRRQFPCNHPLRISAPQYFTHCDTPCQYSGWSDWEEVQGSTRSVAESQCKSREAYTERRTRTSTQSNCNDLTDDRLVCTPDAADKLILALGLGGSDQDLSNVQTNQPNPGGFSPLSKTLSITDNRRCPHTGLNGQVCQHLAGKRSVSYAEEKFSQNAENFNLKTDINAPHSNVHANDDSVMQFSLEEHGHRFRRQTRPENCDSDDIQNVLFVLDSSGSIGSYSYGRMKAAIAKLTPLFCKRVKFAMLTFSTRLNLEFCFNCFENTYDGRNAAANAIKAASYQNGLTYTGEAARCICDELLSADCGISSNPSCMDVVFITDGQSNGRRQICSEIDCLHSKSGINTYAIGINNYDRAELRCIADGSDRLSAFEFRNFDEFEEAIDDVIERLFNQGNPQACAALYSNPTPRPPHQISLDPDSGLTG